jgi:hypothetical protein
LIGPIRLIGRIRPIRPMGRKQMKIVHLQILVSLGFAAMCSALIAAVPVDMQGHDRQSQIVIEPNEQVLRVRWKMDATTTGVVVLNTSGNGRLIHSIGFSDAKESQSDATINLLTQLDPSLQMTLGKSFSTTHTHGRMNRSSAN